MPDQGYDNGGWLEPGKVALTLDPDECILARRDGKWRCIRDHKHGDQLTVDVMNTVDETLTYIKQLIGGDSGE